MASSPKLKPCPFCGSRDIGETVEERRLFKTREGAEELKARMEAEDAKYMACAQPKRTIVRRVVGEWEDA